MKKIKVLALICVMLAFAGGCSMFSGEYTKKEKVVEDLSGCTELQIENRVGSIELKPSSNDSISIEVTKRVKSKDKNSDNEIMENIKIKLIRDGSKAILKAVTASDENIDLWDWKDKNLMNTNISINYILRVPKNIKLHNITNGIGGLSFTDINGIFNLTNDIGDIKLSNIIIEGDSSIINSTGSLNINLNDISNTENINLRTDIGSIDLKLPKSFNFNTEKVDSQITSNILNIINDKTSIKVEAGLGSVKLNGQKVK